MVIHVWIICISTYCRKPVLFYFTYSNTTLSTPMPNELVVIIDSVKNIKAMLLSGISVMVTGQAVL